MKLTAQLLRQIIAEEVAAAAGVGAPPARVTYRKIIGPTSELDGFHAALAPLIYISPDDPGLSFRVRRDGWRMTLDIPGSAVNDFAGLEALMSRYKDVPRTG